MGCNQALTVPLRRHEEGETYLSFVGSNEHVSGEHPYPGQDIMIKQNGQRRDGQHRAASTPSQTHIGESKHHDTSSEALKPLRPYSRHEAK